MVEDDDARLWRLALLVVLGAAALRLALSYLAPLFPDETYYWEWSRRPAASYFDHPPGIAGLIALGTSLLGDTRAGIQTIAFNLPNDERVREAKGSKKVLLRNIMGAKYDKILEPIAVAVTALADGTDCGLSAALGADGRRWWRG